jgi:exodeoxyribonuclease VII large subunit
MSIQDELVLGVSDFVALLNQTLEYAYPSVVIVGELSSLRVSKGKWVYFDLKDEYASVKFFGTVYQLPGPLEDGMMVQVRGVPRLHPQFGFSVNVQFMQPVGEGSLKKAAALLEAKLAAEGLFDPGRKRALPYPPQRVGLITSGESAAYHDFVKILNERWVGVEVALADVQVQGELAPGQIVSAIEYFNSHDEGVDVLVITRGGGSADDLAAFATEQVTRAVAASRIPTMVAIGHEVDVSLAEMAADQRASTPSNAAQLLVPDKRDELARVREKAEALRRFMQQNLEDGIRNVQAQREQLTAMVGRLFERSSRMTQDARRLLQALSPEVALKRGYAIIRKEGAMIRNAKDIALKDMLQIQLADARVDAVVATIVKTTEGKM